MFEEYQKLNDLPETDWEPLPTCDVNAGEFEGDHTLRAWRQLKLDGENCT